MRELAFAAAILGCLWLATRWGDDPHPLAVDASCGVNPCLKMDCTPKPDPRRIA